jgi:hypothetical protein
MTARLCAAAATVVLSWTVFDLAVPDGVGDGARLAWQVGLVAVTTAGAIVAWRYPTVAALLFAAASVGAGLFLAVDHEPAASIAITAVLLMPSILLWLVGGASRGGRAAWLAVIAALAVIACTWLGAVAVHDAF